jgi:teichuronic acid biosynthesis glycosyltransferase TuaC
VLPKVGMNVAPVFLAQAVKPAIGRLLDEGFDFDLIDAHYFYPDGVAAAMLGRYFNKPVVITARGSDITLLPNYRLPRRMILWAANQAAGMITVCNALRDEMIALGVDPASVVSLRNGVDLELFRPTERGAGPAVHPGHGRPPGAGQGPGADRRRPAPAAGRAPGGGRRRPEPRHAGELARRSWAWPTA